MKRRYFLDPQAIRMWKYCMHPLKSITMVHSPGLIAAMIDATVVTILKCSSVRNVLRVNRSITSYQPPSLFAMRKS